MSHSKEALVAHVRFVFEECLRLQNAILKEGLKDLPQHDMLFSLPHPSGTGTMLCGRAAARKITELAEEAAKRGNLSNRIELNTLRKEVSALLVTRFMNEHRSIDTKQIDRLLSTAAKNAEKQCVTLTHFIPCHLMNTNDPNRLAIGPVTFHNRTSFRTLLLKNARTRVESSDEKTRKFTRKLLSHAIRYYRNFQWMAEVEIANCDDASSARIAEEAVTAALDCLHMLLGARWTGRMCIGGANIRSDLRAKIVRTSVGELEPSVSTGGFGEITFSDGWSTTFIDADFKHFQSLFSVALEAVVCPDLERPLSRRFLDAAQWFGEACREKSPATRTVKFVTALERMLMTEERDDITSLVSERVAALCFDLNTTRAEWTEKAKAAYDLRSRLVHGSISPRAPEVKKGADIAAEVTEAALMRAIEAFGVDGLRSEGITSKKLASWFQHLRKWADDNETGKTQ